MRQRRLSVRLAVLIFGSMAAGSASAHHQWGMAGCGLGAVIFHDNSPQISAATTNNTSFTQGSAITSGSSNCTNAAASTAIRQQEEFFTTNLATLAKDMARGQGESVQAMAQLFGCADPQAVGQAVKSSYRRIFAAPGALAVYDQAVDVLKADGRVAPYCTHLI